MYAYKKVTESRLETNIFGQFELKAKIKNMKKIVAEEQKHELNADGFLKIVRKYSEVEELTLDILQEFIDKIVVHHREEAMGETIQKI